MTAYHFNYTNFDGINLNSEIQFFIKKIIFPQMFYFEEKTNNLAYIKYGRFPGGSDGKASAYNAGYLGFDPWVGKIPWRRKWQPTPVFLPGEFHGQRSLVGYSLWGHKELNTTE